MDEQRKFKLESKDPACLLSFQMFHYFQQLTLTEPGSGTGKRGENELSQSIGRGVKDAK